MLDVDTIRLCATYAAQGHSVLVLEPSFPECRATFDKLHAQLGSDLRRVYSMSGWRIEWPNGGTVRVMTPTSDAMEVQRGLAPDMVVHPSVIRDVFAREALLLDATVTVE